MADSTVTPEDATRTDRLLVQKAAKTVRQLSQWVVAVRVYFLLGREGGGGGMWGVNYYASRRLI